MSLMRCLTVFLALAGLDLVSPHSGEGLPSVFLHTLLTPGFLLLKPQGSV